MSKRAVVTGGSSGIGLAIVSMLLSLGYEVIALSRREVRRDHPLFSWYPCDLTQEKEILRTCTLILSQGEVDVLICNAGKGVFAPCEEMGDHDIIAMTKLNFLAPMLMTKHLLRSLKKRGGTIIAISSVTAHKSSPLGAVYAATKAGVAHFYNNLFEEVRKSGVKASVIYPDMTDTPFYEDLSFTIGEDPLSYLTPQCVAQGVQTILESRKESVITSLVIKPQKVQIGKKGKREKKD